MNTSVPGGPDPKENGAIFLGWLKKRGGLRGVVDCERKCKENGFEAKRFIKDMGGRKNCPLSVTGKQGHCIEG